MTHDALVSIVIPVYNVEAYLARCLDSILAQTYPAWEAILVDDKSTDGSWAVCQAYRQKDSRIQALQLPCNAGASAARIAGLEGAQGEYVIFADSDDWLHPTMVETMLRTSQTLDADIVQCAFTATDTFQIRPEDIYIDPATAVVVDAAEAMRQLYGEGQANGFCYLLWNKLFRKELLHPQDLPRERLSINDVPFIPRILYHAKTVALCPEPLYYYFQRNDQAQQSTMDTVKSSYFQMAYQHYKAFRNISDHFLSVDWDVYILSMKLTLVYALSLLKAKPLDPKSRGMALETIRSAPKEALFYLPKAKQLVCRLIRFLYIDRKAL